MCCVLSCPVPSLPSSCFKSRWPRFWCVKLRHYLCLLNILMDVKGGPEVAERGRDRREDASPRELLSQGTGGTRGLGGWELQGSSRSWDGRQTDSSEGGSWKSLQKQRGSSAEGQSRWQLGDTERAEMSQSYKLEWVGWLSYQICVTSLNLLACLRLTHKNGTEEYAVVLYSSIATLHNLKWGMPSPSYPPAKNGIEYPASTDQVCCEGMFSNAFGVLKCFSDCHYGNSVDKHLYITTLDTSAVIGVRSDWHCYFNV